MTSARRKRFSGAKRVQNLTALLALFDLGSWDVPHDPVLNAQSGRRMFRRRKHFLKTCPFDCPFFIDEDDEHRFKKLQPFVKETMLILEWKKWQCAQFGGPLTHSADVHCQLWFVWTIGKVNL
jgi:hypothetical protein